MFYPKFIKKGETIGICAPSAGVGKKLNSFDLSINRLSQDYKILETESVRVNNKRSNSAKKRGEEFNHLFYDDTIQMVICASGGNFLFEVLPYIDWNAIKKNPKWFMGYSDPTSILYILTTKYDIATLYGMNGGSFDIEHVYVDQAFAIMKGDLIPQQAYDTYQSCENFCNDICVFDQKAEWICSQEFVTSGRCIGGCLEVIKDLMGTEYDDTKAFLERYKDDGFIWYFDNFAMSAEDMYRTLLQMKYAGYFKYAKAVLLGRVCFESHDEMSYLEALQYALDDIPYVMGCDIGHISPRFTLINGAMMTLSTKTKTIQFELK